MNTDVIILLMADGMLLPLGVVTLYALGRLPVGNRWKMLVDIILAGLGTLIIAKVLGVVITPEEVRPFLQYGLQAKASYLGNPGFPSDHVLLGMFMTVTVWWILRNKWVTAIMFGMVTIMAIGRVLGLVHTTLDVVGAMVIGCIGLIWYYRHSIFNKMLRKS